MTDTYRPGHPGHGLTEVPEGDIDKRLKKKAVRLRSELIHMIPNRSWGAPSDLHVGKIWRCDEMGTITCVLAGKKGSGAVVFDCRELVCAETTGLAEWMPGAWRRAAYQYVRKWPASAGYLSPFLAIDEKTRMRLVRKLLVEAWNTDDIGLYSAAEIAGQFSSHLRIGEER